MGVLHPDDQLQLSKKSLRQIAINPQHGCQAYRELEYDELSRDAGSWHVCSRRPEGCSTDVYLSCRRHCRHGSRVRVRQV